MPQSYSTVPLYSLRLIKEKSVRYPVANVPNEILGAKVLRAYLNNKDCEHLVALLLDHAHNFIGIHLITIGTIASIPGVAVRDIFKAAIVGSAAGIIIGHNHPSSDTTPSEQDIAFTKQVKKASEVMGIPLLDHIIVSSGIRDGQYSFLANGLL